MLHQIKEEGLLSNVRFAVYEALVQATEQGETVSAGELFYRMKKLGRNPSHSNVATRLGELRESGIAEEVGTKTCSITKREVIAWRALDALPEKIGKAAKGASTKEKLSRAVQALKWYAKQKNGETAQVVLDELEGQLCLI